MTTELSVARGSWKMFLAFRWKGHPTLPDIPDETVYGPNGAKNTTDLRYFLEIQDPATKLWRPSSTVFPGETWRLSYMDTAVRINGESYTMDRKEYEEYEADFREPSKVDHIAGHVKSLRVLCIMVFILSLVNIITISLRGVWRP